MHLIATLQRGHHFSTCTPLPAYIRIHHAIREGFHVICLSLIQACISPEIKGARPHPYYFIDITKRNL